MLPVFLGFLWLCVMAMSIETNGAILEVLPALNRKDFAGILTGDDTLTVFADGRLVGYNGGAWDQPRWLSFPSETNVIAVLVYNGPNGFGGFLGVFSNGVVTDSSWKCNETSITPDDGWEQTNFPDNAWPNAFVRHDNSGRGPSTHVLGIPKNVHWISAENHDATRFMCRRRLSEEERLSKSTLITILATNLRMTIELYLDGVFTTKSVGSLTVVKDQHQLLAVHVEDKIVVDADVYFVASSSNGVRTNRSWKCTNKYHQGWFLPNFTDISWPKPYADDFNKVVYFVAPDAKWIAYLLEKSNKIFCRQNATLEYDLHIVPSYDTSSSGYRTSVFSLVSQMTILPTKSISSSTMFDSSSAAQNLTSSPTNSSEWVSPNTKTLSTTVVVVIAIGGATAAVVIGLALPCYIWRKWRENTENELQMKVHTRDKWEIKSNDVTIYEELGRGAFGKVFKGIMQASLSMNRTSKNVSKSTITVAVKMLQENVTPDQLNDFLQEITLMKVVGSHKNIVNFIGCCTKSSPNFLVVEYAAKGDLLSFLRERRKKVNMEYVQIRENTPETPRAVGKDTGTFCELGVNDIGEVNVAFLKTDNSIDIRINSAPEELDPGYDENDSLTPQDMMSFSWQIAQGMQYLSEKGIVHRDLAARNVLLCDDKLVKVADFGLARSTLGENVYHVTGLHNKLPVKWMSPEAINDGIFTTKSDVWSYGVLLWEIATLGGFPYPGIKSRELMRLLRRGYRMEKPDTCSDEFYQLMTRCWTDNPDMRPTFRELCQDLEDWMEREVPYLNLNQLDEDQPYYDASVVSLSSGSSCTGQAPVESLASNTDIVNLARDRNGNRSEFTSF